MSLIPVLPAFILIDLFSYGYHPEPMFAFIRLLLANPYLISKIFLRARLIGFHIIGTNTRRGPYQLIDKRTNDIVAFDLFTKPDRLLPEYGATLF